MSESVLDLVMNSLGGRAKEQVSRRIGADERSTEQALGAAVPLLLQALQRNAQRPEGADALAGALERDHDGSLLDNLTGFLQQPEQGNGAGILGHVLGGKRRTVETGLAKSTGLDSSQVGNLLEMVAPIVLGALGKKKRQDDLGAGGLGDLLGRERERVARREPQAADLLTSLLDQDGDGSVLDDIAGKLGGGLLGKFFGGR